MSAGATASAARVEAQAKVNLFLRVIARAPDGYHELETLFQRIALADTVTVRTSAHGRSLDCGSALPGRVEDNLAWRAAVAFAATVGWPSGFAIEIEKRIPVGGGLGGGSADAAAVLRALNAMTTHPLAPAPLASLALSLGADIPYLTTTRPLALGRGRGEQLTIVEPLAARSLLLLVPAFGVSTAEAFSWYADAALLRGARPHGAGTLPVHPSWSDVSAHAENDLEDAVFVRRPELEVLRQSLASHGASIARMTGSGSVIFGLFESNAAASRARAAIGAAVPGAQGIETMTVEQVAAVELL